MPNFTDLLARIANLEAKLNVLTQQSSYIQLATVTDNQDPLRLRRVRVTREIQGGQLQSYWANCGRASSYTDEPLPQIGSTVIIALIDGDPHQIVILKTIANDTNPVDARQDDPIADHTVEIPGIERHEVVKDRFVSVSGKQDTQIEGTLNVDSKGAFIDINSEGNINVTAKQTITISNSAGASLTLFANGSIRFADNAGRQIYLGGITDNQAIWDLNNTSINVINVSDFRIENKTVATIGAVDSRGDQIVSRGW